LRVCSVSARLPAGDNRPPGFTFQLPDESISPSVKVNKVLKLSEVDEVLCMGEILASVRMSSI